MRTSDIIARGQSLATKLKNGDVREKLKNGEIRDRVLRLAQGPSFLTKPVLAANHRWGKLRDIEAKNHSLDPSMLKKCREYAADVFGDEVYAHELAVYCAVQGSWREGWVPNSYFFDHIIRKSSRVYKLSDEKTLSAYFLGNDLLPDIGYFSNGYFFSKKWEVIPVSQLSDVLFDGRDRIVFKRNASVSGRGVFVFSRESFSPASVQGLGNGCFQDYIQPHPSVPTFGVGSVCTLRLVTTVDRTGTVTRRYCSLRLARAHHTHVMGKDSVRMPVCMETGKLQAYGYLSDWTRVWAHPDTGIAFDGVVYPRIRDAVSLCMDLHRKLSGFISIGWDLCLDASGDFKIMEWNQQHDIKVAEAMDGPHFADLGWGVKK